MSDILRALILGVVQGLTEFLPVSSSGHLEIANELMSSDQSINSDLFMVIMVHLGTAFSILYVFRKDILQILTDIFTFKNTESSRLSIQILISMIPALIIGLMFEKKLEQLFEGSILWVGVFLICTAIVLYFTPTDLSKLKGKVNYSNSFLIGMSQAVAILPGLSRSGMTIATALYLNIGREQAAKFSFLMVLPVIFGKIILDIFSGDLMVNESNYLPVGVALISSFIVGVWACKWMIELVKKSQLKYFAYYCLVIGLLTIAYHLYG
jgi:undecaprenyl-diphosphatase